MGILEKISEIEAEVNIIVNFQLQFYVLSINSQIPGSWVKNKTHSHQKSFDMVYEGHKDSIVWKLKSEGR